MNRKLRTTLVVVIVIGVGLLIARNVGWGSAAPEVNPEIVHAAAESSRRVQVQEPPVEDIPRQGRAAPAAMTGSGR